MEKYEALLGYLRQFFRDKLVSGVGEEATGQFKEWLSKRIAARTLHERMMLMCACWNWGIKQKLLDTNPWVEVLKGVKVTPQQKPKPLTREEIEKILKGFKDDRYYAHYSDYVEFLLSTGCRTGEAIGLRWKHLNQDCSVMWIGELESRASQGSEK